MRQNAPTHDIIDHKYNLKPIELILLIYDIIKITKYPKTELS